MTSILPLLKKTSTTLVYNQHGIHVIFFCDPLDYLKRIFHVKNPNFKAGFIGMENRVISRVVGRNGIFRQFSILDYIGTAASPNYRPARINMARRMRLAQKKKPPALRNH